jgi:hypothetical protein
MNLVCREIGDHKVRPSNSVWNSDRLIRGIAFEASRSKPYCRIARSIPDLNLKFLLASVAIRNYTPSNRNPEKRGISRKTGEGIPFGEAGCDGI